MKVVLLETTKGLGEKGDVAEVSEGFARNFLFPQHKAIEATPQKLRELKEQKAAVERSEKKEVKEHRALATAIDGAELIIPAKADGISLYAAITVTDIARALKEQGHKVPKKFIQFNPAKETGEYKATIAFPSGFDAVVSVTIEAA
jgi:large subunit ribosomal protein L9